MGIRSRYRRSLRPDRLTGRRADGQTIEVRDPFARLPAYPDMFSTIALANPLQLTSVAPGIRRSKS
jgi:hypothetical protein